jgi:acetoin utilization deacetylase AcuC-like enzyme
LHPEGPGRIPAIERELSSRDWLGYSLRDAPAVDLKVLRLVHPATYVDEVRFMSERGGGSFDPDTVASSGTYEAALHGAGGAVALVEALVGGEASVGFSGLRPPGHHAEPRVAMGFCFFNNVAVAARYALDVLGLSRVFVLDWDVHHGNGTNDIFSSSSEVLFASIHQYPWYPGTGPLSDVGSDSGEGFSLNLPVPSGSGPEVWLSLVEHVVVPAALSFSPELVLVSAGFDAHADDPLGTCRLSSESFAAMALWMRSVADGLGVPVGAVLEGGYDLRALAASCAASLEAFASGGAPPSVEPHPLAVEASRFLGRWWPLPLADGSAG